MWWGSEGPGQVLKQHPPHTPSATVRKTEAGTGDNGRLLRGRGLAADMGPTTKVQTDVRGSWDFIRGPSV